MDFFDGGLKLVNFLVQKQILHQQKALDLSYLELEAQGRGSIIGVPSPSGAEAFFVVFLQVR